MQTTLYWHKPREREQGQEKAGGKDSQGAWINFWEKNNMFIIFTMMMISPVHTHVKTYQTLHIKCMSFTACELYLNTTLKEKCNAEWKQCLIASQVTGLSCQSLPLSLTRVFCSLWLTFCVFLLLSNPLCFTILCVSLCVCVSVSVCVCMCVWY